ncbi:MAG: enoyl-CoA hydratase/isomerase family protein [Xanthobacteraceae bacterium]|uniref:enoyl-CoA hydratase/isomerase family protein n=1 Tax=Pseudolabrys sp. TaxID=1960880 RepID=UPI003D0C51D9
MTKAVKVPDSDDPKTILAAGGVSPKAAAAWLKSEPRVTMSYARDTAAHGKFWKAGTDLLAKLPRKPTRSAAEQRAAEAILTKGRASREAYLMRHADAIYRKLTKNLSNFVRLEQLAYDAAKLVPGLVPSRKQVDAEAQFKQGEKDGVEVDQGIFLAHVLADPANGMHLCEAMLWPKPEALERAAEYARTGLIDFGAARVERQGKASVVTIQNPRYLNAEDTGTLDDTETAADIAILDADSQICVLRGGPVQHPKYAGRRVFCSGINLTHIYNGKIPYLWYIVRDMGIVNKMMRGLATGTASPDEVHGGTREKSWITGVDVFAIGGGCQYLLAMDYVVAGKSAYMTLPARKEGIIPGLANLRFPRFVGPRIARQAIMMDKRIDCDSPEGKLMCDLVVPDDQVDSAIAGVVEDYTSSGVVSASGNRRALRVGEEPLDLFRRYMATYCREQAYCHFSPALIANLEKHWNAASRKM